MNTMKQIVKKLGNRIWVMLLIQIMLGSFIQLNAQQKQPYINFTAVVHDFGKIKEADGLASFKFEFTNTGSVPLVISNVQASCGCTTPSWTREPIAPGAKGSITATYNPKNRPGRFDKSITVTSNSENTPTVLRIMGEVLPQTPMSSY